MSSLVWLLVHRNIILATINIVVVVVYHGIMLLSYLWIPEELITKQVTIHHSSLLPAWCVYPTWTGKQPQQP